MRILAAIGFGVGMLGACGSAIAAECANPDALGTSRVMTIDPGAYPKIGVVQYQDSLPLADKEVVLTFDDGPMPPYTNRILETLANECVKVNYFIIGRMARGYPDLLKRILAEGHIIGTHSETHPLAFDKMPQAEVRAEIEQGFASVRTALGNPGAVAPFFRIPGLLRAPSVEAYLRSRNLVTWSADITGDDWKHISAAEVVQRVMSRLQERGRGIILLHDIQPATALALPELLRRLKREGYRIVQVAPAPAAAAPPVASAPKTPAVALATPTQELPRPPAPIPSLLQEPARAPSALPRELVRMVPPRSVAPPQDDVPHNALPVPVVLEPAASAQASAGNPAQNPAMPLPGENSAALDPSSDPTRPFSSGLKPSLSISRSPGKLLPRPGPAPHVSLRTGASAEERSVRPARRRAQIEPTPSAPMRSPWRITSAHLGPVSPH